VNLARKEERRGPKTWPKGTNRDNLVRERRKKRAKRHGPKGLFATLPGPSSSGESEVPDAESEDEVRDSLGPSSDDDDDQADAARLCREGGVSFPFQHLLLSKTVSELQETRSSLKEWTYRDIMRLPSDRLPDERCGMQNCKTAATPLPAGYMPEPVSQDTTINPELRSRYQTVIGSLLYLMLGTRPDIAFAVTKLAQYAARPSEDHLNKALYICRYLRGTSKYCLTYDGTSGEGLVACTDSDWASDHEQRRSQSGYFLKLAGGAISWTSRAQRTVALSSTEAEYMALSDCSRQVVWMHTLMGELGYKLKPIPICGDNQGSIFIASNPVTEKRSKHIDIRYHLFSPPPSSSPLPYYKVRYRVAGPVWSRIDHALLNMCPPSECGCSVEGN
jgi:hypothetical protein